jgi:beta-glucanase (GH16 family)
MHRARHSVTASRLVRPRVIAAVVVASAGLATAVWLPSRFDNAEATERRDRDRARSEQSDTDRVTFSDDFSGNRGDSVDPAKWRFADGPSDDGVQVFTDSTRNARLDGDGNLVLTTRRGENGEITSARLLTRETFADERGRVEARIRVADDQGVRSALELLGADDLTVADNIGSKSKVIRGEFGDVEGQVERRNSFADDFHTFTVDWEPGRIVWSVDGREFLRSDRSFAQAFTPSLALTVGSRRAGAPDDNTRFPQRMTIDFLRVTAEPAKDEPPAEEPPAEEPPATPPTSEAPPPPATTPPTTPPTTEPPATTPPTTAPPTTAPPPPAAEPWAPFKILAEGDRVTFGGATYEVQETHTSLPGWEPTVLPLLFQKV